MKSLKQNKVFITVMLVILTVAAFASAGNGFKMPKYDKFQLDNGITVYLMENHEVPLIYVSTVFLSGAVNDNDKYGLASLTADALMFGTKSYSKTEIEDTFDFLGASVSTTASREASYIDMSFASKDFAAVLPFWREMVQMPVFDEAEFNKRKDRLLIELEQAKESPNSVAGSYYNKFIFGDHPYGNPVGGTRSTVADITLNDVKKFYKTNYGAGQTAIVVSGDFKKKDMKKQISKAFSGWKQKSTLAAGSNYGTLPAHAGSRVLLVNKEDSRQTTFLIGALGIKRSNPDYVAIQVINTILGGRFTSWLNDELRVNAGLTYGARSRFSPYKEAGTFYVSSFTATPTTVDAIDLAMHVLDSLHTTGVNEATLTSAKKYINGQFPPRYETAGNMADLMASMYVYGFDESYINEFQNEVKNMTMARSKEIINKYFPKENLQFMLIGKAADIREQVKKYGTLSEKEIKADGF